MDQARESAPLARRGPACGGPEEAGGPERRCIVTREVLPKSRMVRFIVGPDDELVADVTGRLPGRGIWLSARRDVVNTACAKRMFARAARRPVRVPEGLAEGVRAQLAGGCLGILGMARRAGEAVCGFERCRGWLAKSRGAVLVEAAEGAAAGRAELVRLAPGMPVIDSFSGAELGRVMGRDQVVHVVLANGSLARRFTAEAARLGGFVEVEDDRGGTSSPRES